MNNKGFTIAELVAVLALIAIISLITFPNLNNLRKNNNEKEYTTIEDMMVQYTKVIPNYKTRSYVCLKNLNLKINERINPNLICNGYVKITDGSLKPYLYCTQNGVDMYKTNGYSLPGDC